MPATKNAAKKVRGKLFKQVKNRDLDDAATAKIAEGDAAMNDSNYDEAIAIFSGPATELVMACPKKTKPTAPQGSAKGGGAAAKANDKAKAKDKKPKKKEADESVPEIDVAKLLPIPPEKNTIAKQDAAQTCSYAVNSAENLAAHLAVTKGRWQTRFPPEPNGYLHLGHAKAINFNFLVAAVNGGQCLLRFDDTNPAAEKKEYIDMIIENLEWLGHHPSSITYSSDYFQVWGEGGEEEEEEEERRRWCAI